MRPHEASRSASHRIPSKASSPAESGQQQRGAKASRTSAVPLPAKEPVDEDASKRPRTASPRKARVFTIETLTTALDEALKDSNSAGDAAAIAQRLMQPAEDSDSADSSSDEASRAATKDRRRSDEDKAVALLAEKQPNIRTQAKNRAVGLKDDLARQLAAQRLQTWAQKNNSPLRHRDIQRAVRHALGHLPLPVTDEGAVPKAFARWIQSEAKNFDATEKGRAAFAEAFHARCKAEGYVVSKEQAARAIEHQRGAQAGGRAEAAGASTASREPEPQKEELPPPAASHLDERTRDWIAEHSKRFPTGNEFVNALQRVFAIHNPGYQAPDAGLALSYRATYEAPSSGRTANAAAAGPGSAASAEAERTGLEDTVPTRDFMKNLDDRILDAYDALNEHRPRGEPKYKATPPLPDLLDGRRSKERALEIAQGDVKKAIKLLDTLMEGQSPPAAQLLERSIELDSAVAALDRRLDQVRRARRFEHG